MSSSGEFLHWHSNKDVVTIFDVMQKMIASNHNKALAMFKLRCTLPDLVKICVPNFTDAIFYRFKEGDKMLLQKIKEDTLGHPSIMFTRITFAEKTFIVNQRTFANQLFAVILLNYIRTKLVIICPQDFARVGILIQRLATFHSDRTRPIAVKLSACSAHQTWL